MRIVGGQYRGKKLWSPEGKNVRPTSERAREAIFNILYSKLGGDYTQTNMADIFAGTGAFGFEALSRGFNSVTFVDIDTTAVQKNIKLFPKESTKIHIIKADATRLPRLHRQFNLVFMDAPYAQGYTQTVLHQLIEQEWLADKALCIVEIHKNERWPLPDCFELLDERVYGLARILFIRKR